MNYRETINYLYDRLPMFSRIGKDAYKKDLTNTLLLCGRLGEPHKKFKTVHIAGTNGKGSVSHMLAAIMHTAGYKTGLYTSPHLYDFRERIKIGGAMIPEDFVIHFVQRTGALIDEIEPSFFELTVAMAFDYFAQEGIDIGIIEVGLGGRLDSTNIITPELSIITNISIDHTNILGSTVEEIAFEKGGIIKESVPVVIGERGNDTDEVFLRLAAQKEAPLLFAEDVVKTEIVEAKSEGLAIKVQGKNGQDTLYHLDLPGRYQEKNLRTTIAAIEVLQSKGWSIAQDKIKEALQDVKGLTHFGGRWDVIKEAPMVVLEVAHNEGGIKQMLQHLDTLTYRQLHIIIGMVKDKAADIILQLLPPGAAYYFTQAQIPRALDKHDLQNAAKAYNLRGLTFDDVNTALHKAIDSASKEDVIIVCGSIFLVAEVDKTMV